MLWLSKSANYCGGFAIFSVNFDTDSIRNNTIIRCASTKVITQNISRMSKRGKCKFESIDSVFIIIRDRQESENIGFTGIVE